MSTIIDPFAEGAANSESGIHSRAGAGQIVFAKGTAGTLVVRAAAISPLRLLALQNPRGNAWVYTSTFGGGLLAGDEISLEIECQPDTTAYLSSQSSTKVYRNSDGAPARQNLSATIGENALLAIVPDPLVCYAEARYRQRQRFELAGSASCVLLDWFTSGRHACGERWQMELLHSRNEIVVAGRRLLMDVFSLCARDGPLGDRFRMGACNCFATLVMLGPRLAESSGRLLSLVARMPVGRDPALTVGASPLGDGMILRLAAADVEHAALFLKQPLACLEALLGEHPWSRKW